MADRRAQIEARLSRAALDGSGRAIEGSSTGPSIMVDADPLTVMVNDSMTEEEADEWWPIAALIAHAPDDLRWLLDTLAEAEAERDALRDRALAAEAKVARVEALIEGVGDGNLKTSHLRAALETNIEDAYERGRVHAEDDAYRRIRAALEAGEDR